MEYIVKEGDTLSSIALKFSGNAELWPVLADLNHLPLPDLIFAGQKLMLPTSWDSSQPPPIRHISPGLTIKTKPPATKPFYQSTTFWVLMLIGSVVAYKYYK